MTVDELIATLRHSFLPNVIVEGKDDIIVYRKIEEELEDFQVSVVPAGGRSKVLEIFDRRSEIHNQSPLAFIADKDNWVLDNVPSQYLADDLIFTEGYSIENDLFVDGELERVMNTNEKAKFAEELTLFIRWYASAIHNNSLDGVTKFDVHPNAFFDEGWKERLLANLCDPYPEDLNTRLCTEYQNLLRGKSLMALLIRQLSYSGRLVRHNTKSLMEIASSRQGDRIGRIFRDVRIVIEKEKQDQTSVL